MFSKTETMNGMRNCLSLKRRPGLTFLYLVFALSGVVVVKQYTNTRWANVNELDSWSLNLGRWDSSLSFKIHDFGVVGKNFRQETTRSNVCLATQASIDSMHWLPYLTKNWGGAVSVATITTGPDYECTVNYLKYLQQCHPDVMQNVAVHIVFPKDELLVQERIEEPDWADFSCSNERKSLKEICTPEQVHRWRTGDRVYPQNLLRNLARKGCNTEYVYLADIDVIPSANMSVLLEEFFKNDGFRCEKCAYVIPAFELDEKSRFPDNKEELLQLERNNLTQPYRYKAFPKNQGATNYTLWKAYKDTGRVVVSHNVTEYEFLYEPFYVSRDTAPPHDERFLGYGFTRNTQVLEMVRSGWQFQVITPVFGIHWGIKAKFDRPKWQLDQTDINRTKYKLFKKELDSKYGPEPKPKNKKVSNATVIQKTKPKL